MYVATSGKMVLTCARTRVGIGHANVEFPARGTSGTLQLAAPIAGASQMLATLSQCDFQASRSSTDQGAWVAAGLSRQPRHGAAASVGPKSPAEESSQRLCGKNPRLGIPWTRAHLLRSRRP